MARVCLLSLTTGYIKKASMTMMETLYWFQSSSLLWSDQFEMNPDVFPRWRISQRNDKEEREEENFARRWWAFVFVSAVDLIKNGNQSIEHCLSSFEKDWAVFGVQDHCHKAASNVKSTHNWHRLEIDTCELSVRNHHSPYRLDSRWISLRRWTRRKDYVHLRNRLNTSRPLPSWINR